MLAKFSAWLDRAQTYFLNLWRVWWRPLGSMTIVASIFVAGIFNPIFRKVPADLMGLAACITSFAGLYAVREWGKAQGANDPQGGQDNG